MNLISRWTILAGLAAARASSLNLAAAPRTEVSLNAGWRFHFGETPGAEAAGFDASAWSTVSTPHTWNALDGQDGVKSASV